MKFALVEGERREAKPGLSGTCPLYGHVMIAKCGKHRAPHWAHRANSTCDHWWEPETEWHRDWKNQFPVGCQEIIHISESGEKHIADVKTASGVVVEFQHSLLHLGEREARENFYPKMVWVVDGRRRARDRARFFAILRSAKIINVKPLIALFSSNEGALLRDWGDSRVPVYFDFGDSEPNDTPRFDMPVLWRLNPRGQNAMAYLSPVPKTEFLRAYIEGLPFDEMFSEFIERAAVGYLMQQTRHMARRQVRRRRSRF